MSNVKPKMSIIQCLSKIDKSVLMAVYDHRCLDEILIHEYFYKPDGTDEEFTSTRIDFFVDNGLLELVDYGAEQPALFLTTIGIQTLKVVFDIPAETWDPKLEKLRPTLKNATKIKIAPPKIRHQMHLNSFVLKFKAMADKAKLSYQYFDETYTGNFDILRPDGVISLSNYDVFLEMDMATERGNALTVKWDHYRNYMGTKEYLYREKKVIVLFITSNVRRIRTRRDTVLSTLNQHLFDQISPNFEFFIGNEEQLLSTLEDRFINKFSAFSANISEIQKILLDYHGYSSSLAYNLVTEIQETPFDLYIRRLNERQNIIVTEGRAQEFFVDSFFNEPISVLQKISFYQSQIAYIKTQFGREISYLVIVEDVKSLYRDLSILDIRNIKNVYFTTIKRLKTSMFCEAIFQFDSMGNLYHFSDDVFNKPVFEQKMRL